MALPKSSPFRPFLQYNQIRNNENGANDGVKRRWINSDEPEECDDGFYSGRRDDFDGLDGSAASARKLVSLFGIFAVGVGTSVAVLAAEGVKKMVLKRR